MRQRKGGLVLSILIAEGVGIFSGFLAGDSRGFYQNLILPPLSPPGWLFPVVWAILYATMGIAAYWVFGETTKKPGQKKVALTLYGLQLFVNFIWSIFFFRWEMFGFSVLIILFLIVLVGLTILAFYSIRPDAGIILIPYLLWIIFAAYLNIAICVLN